MESSLFLKLIQVLENQRASNLFKSIMIHFNMDKNHFNLYKSEIIIRNLEDTYLKDISHYQEIIDLLKNSIKTGTYPTYLDDLYDIFKDKCIIDTLLININSFYKIMSAKIEFSSHPMIFTQLKSLNK